MSGWFHRDSEGKLIAWPWVLRSTMEWWRTNAFKLQDELVDALRRNAELRQQARVLTEALTIERQKNDVLETSFKYARDKISEMAAASEIDKPEKPKGAFVEVFTGHSGFRARAERASAKTRVAPSDSVAALEKKVADEGGTTNVSS